MLTKAAQNGRDKHFSRSRKTLLMTTVISILGVLKIIANGVGSVVTTKHATLFLLNLYVSYFTRKPFRGKLSPSLIDLKYLNYLDLSHNDFNQSQIPKFIGFLSNLRYLYLSQSNFGRNIPFQLGNLSNLLLKSNESNLISKDALQDEDCS